jgi:hypothetical protein
VRVFAESTDEKSIRLSRAQQKSFTTLTSISNNKDWNITIEDYIRELMATEDSGPSRSEESRTTTSAQPNYDAFCPILESDDTPADSESARSSVDSRQDPRTRNKRLIGQVLDIIYPTTLRYRVVHITQEDGRRNTHLVLMERSPDTNGRRAPSNIAPATVIIESDDAHYCLSPHRAGGATGLTTLQDMLRFNPGNLNTSLKKGFLVYQLLKAVKGLHENGLIHGNINPSNIYIDENLWISLTGIKCSVPHRPANAFSNAAAERSEYKSLIGIPKGQSRQC